MSIRFGRLLVAAMLAGSLLAINHNGLRAQTSSDEEKNARLQWWRDARFGMFIHWGLYCIPAGEWKGQAVPGIGEWIMNRAHIPVNEYEQLAKKFNPVQFNADEFVRVAKAAGQRYMVITAKHHDGFAMFRSRFSKYNVYDATPFHRDVIAELAAACKRQNMPLGFYYSQTQDWHEKDGDGNTWDFDPKQANFAKYFHEKAVPQVRELLTNYGPVALIWFDTPKNITAAQSKELVDLVHQLQPKCLVDGRIGNDAGDYVSTGDNEIPSKKLSTDWEVPATLNDTWGFKTHDTNWKSPQTLIRQLVDIVSKNGNYLLNVGPTSEGLIPPASVDRLQQVGQWLKTNGDAVYGAKPSPYPYEFAWGSITAKPNRLFLNIVEWPKDGKFELLGLNNKVSGAHLLSGKTSVKYKAANNALVLTLPSAPPDPTVSVVQLTVDGSARADQTLMQQPDGIITLNGQFAQLPSGSKAKPSNRGILNNWASGETAQWRLQVHKAGTYQVLALTAKTRNGDPFGPSSSLKVSIDGQAVQHPMQDQGKIPDPRNPLFPDTQTNLGTVKLKPGETTLTAQAETGDIHLRQIVLRPQ